MMDGLRQGVSIVTMGKDNSLDRRFTERVDCCRKKVV